jgi:hypothetical protein
VCTKVLIGKVLVKVGDAGTPGTTHSIYVIDGQLVRAEPQIRPLGREGCSDAFILGAVEPLPLDPERRDVGQGVHGWY